METKNVKNIYLVQWGSEKSVVLMTYYGNFTPEYLLMNNDYILNLDDMGLNIRHVVLVDL